MVLFTLPMLNAPNTAKQCRFAGKTSLRSPRSGAKQSQERNINEHQGFVYLMTNRRNNVIYAGVTSDLKKRVYEHKEKLVEGFTKKYRVEKLVYYEVFEDIETAILREKQTKAGSRRKKLELITSMNPSFRDLYDEF